MLASMTGELGVAKNGRNNGRSKSKPYNTKNGASKRGSGAKEKGEEKRASPSTYVSPGGLGGR